MSSGAAIVTTLRNAEAVLQSFVTYHQAIGFDHIYLIFDDPSDPSLARARAMTGVTAIAHDQSLRETWRSLPSFLAHGAFTDTEVMSRQVLNVEYVGQLAKAAGHAWLLSIDSDELFFPTDESVETHFANLTASGVETVVYQNFEAVPESDQISDFFREVTLFKPSPFIEGIEQIRANTPSLPPQLTPYFHFYANGKSSFRLDGSGLRPLGVHAFERRGGAIKRASTAHYILHYACCGFEAFWTKYSTLGAFKDQWWGKVSIADAIGTFHLEARDAVAAGPSAARAFYDARVMLSDQSCIDELIHRGVLVRLREPKSVIETSVLGP